MRQKMVWPLAAACWLSLSVLVALRLGGWPGWGVGGLTAAGAWIGLRLRRAMMAREQALAELKREKLRVEQALSEKSSFLANLSHEIRTPMSAILGFSDLLESEPLTPRQARHIKSIRQSGHSLMQLINDVLDLSKLEAGKLDLHREPTDLRELGGFLRTMFAQRAVAKSIQLRLEFEGAPNILLLDRLRLRQALVNLVGNAVKFTEQGYVRVKVAWLPLRPAGSRGTLSIRVEDTGIGISPEKQQEIFEPFVQSHQARAVENEGAGLGLHIVQRLTEIMGGSVRLESTEGKGSTFQLVFPDVAVSAGRPAGDNLEADSPSFNEFAPATLLVVDDNRANRDLIAALFERTHHQVRLARDGREALASIAEHKPDLVLLDIRMPGMDGNEVLAEIRGTPGLEDLPVIAVTASSREGEEEELRGRFSGFVRKPFTSRALFDELARFLRRQGRAGGSAVPAPGGGEPVAAGAGEDRQLLLSELRVLLGKEWADLRESIAINETQVFAHKLQALARRTLCRPLLDYSDALAQNAEAYAIKELEEQLATFPELVEKLETQQPTLSDA